MGSPERDRDDETADEERAREQEEKEEQKQEGVQNGERERGGEVERSRERDWEFGLDDVGPEVETERRLEPQPIDPANALFVLLGAAAAMGVVWLLLF